MMTGERKETIRPDWRTLSRADKVKLLRPLVKQDLSASAIAARFQGVSRNAILGFCQRAGLVLANARPVTARAPAKQKPRRVRAAPPRPIGNRASVELDIPPEPDTATAVLFADALDRGLCKWPLWATFGPEAKCCGAPRAGTGPYCEHHAHRAFHAP